MLSYPYIRDLFRAILAQSKAIAGRVHFAAYWLSEINSDNLSQLVSESLGGNKQIKKYPLALIMPPRSRGAYTATEVADAYTIRIFFLKQAGVTSSGAIQAINYNTNKTTHGTVEDWHDMGRAARAFMQVLHILIKEHGLGERFVADTANSIINPITHIGNDKLSGVELSFQATIYNTCTPLEDYPENFFDNLNLPTGDSHPEHPL